MTNQLQGEILFGGWDDAQSQWAYTPWMPVRGDYGTFGVEVLYNVGPISLKWNVETRKVEEPESSAVDLLSNQLNEVVVTSSSTPAKQWVRYKFSTGGSANVTDFVIFRALQPSWLVDR